MAKPLPIITICSSANFYRQAVDVQAKLQQRGFSVIIPGIAEIMKQSGDFDVDHYRTWFGNAEDYHKKTTLIRAHFDEVAKADSVLVLNYEKNGKPNYIGGNVLMEMALGFYLKKPLYLMNEIPEESTFLEEIIGMNPVMLHGNLDGIK